MKDTAILARFLKFLVPKGSLFYLFMHLCAFEPHLYKQEGGNVLQVSVA